MSDTYSNTFVVLPMDAGALMQGPYFIAICHASLTASLVKSVLSIALTALAWGLYQSK